MVVNPNIYESRNVSKGNGWGDSGECSINTLNFCHNIHRIQCDAVSK